METRDSLRNYLFQTVDVKAKISRKGELKFKKKLKYTYRGSNLTCPVARIKHEYDRITDVDTSGKTLCIEDILINDTPVKEDVSHVWVTDHVGDIIDGDRVHFIGVVGKYETKEKEAYAFEVIGTPKK